MSQYSIIAPGNGYAGVRSGHGSTPWMYVGEPSIRATNIGSSKGTQWAVWNVYIPSAIAGENVTTLRMRGGHDYTVAEGGTGYSRVVTLGVSILRSVAAFVDVTAALAIGSRIGSGVGANVDANVSVAGFTSDDLRNGSMFVGLVGSTNGADVGFQSDLYRMGVLTWDIYTGVTSPTPPYGDPYGTMANPTANSSPGKFAVTQQFANIQVTWVDNGRGPQTYIDYIWTISGSGVTFASTGTNTWTDRSGTYYKPGIDWAYSNCGVMNIAASAMPGTYTITCHCDDRISGVPNVYLTSQLVVRRLPVQLTEA